MQDDSLSVAVIGYGYWGSRVAATVKATDGFHLCAIIDPAVQGDFLLDAPVFPVNLEKGLFVLRDLNPDVIYLCTPPSTHVELALEVLGLSRVLVITKPLALTVPGAREILMCSEQLGQKIVVDYTYLFSPEVAEMKKIVDSGQIGRPIYFSSHRSNLGLFQDDCDVIWDLAVHDFAIAHYLTGSHGSGSISAFGSGHPSIANFATASCHFQSSEGFVMNIMVSWESPLKIRNLWLVGEEGSISFDDVLPSGKLKLVAGSVRPRGEENSETLESRHISYAVGDTRTISVEGPSPLARELKYVGDLAAGAPDRMKTLDLALWGCLLAEAADHSMLRRGAQQEVVVS